MRFVLAALLILGAFSVGFTQSKVHEPDALLNKLATNRNVTSTDAFRLLTSLNGNWEGKFPDGRLHTVAYRLTAAGSVLVETWTLGPNRESLTLYSIDGSNLMATHFCPQGNQPRLRLVQGNDSTKLSFEFLDGANLQVPAKAHQRAFWLRIDGPNSFTRSETYVKNGSTAAEIAQTTAGEAITYTRIAPTHQNRKLLSPADSFGAAEFNAKTPRVLSSY